MSKLWSIHPCYLDSSRLLREHQSIHKLINEVTRKVDNSKNRFYKYGGYLAWRHYLAVCEMRIRHMNHESFIDQFWKLIPESRRLILYRYPKEAIKKDLQTLRPKQHKAITAAGTGGRVAITGFPNELNEQVELIAKNGLPRDCFLL